MIKRHSYLIATLCLVFITFSLNANETGLVNLKKTKGEVHKSEGLTSPQTDRGIDTVLKEGFESRVLPEGWEQIQEAGSVSWLFQEGGHDGNPSGAETDSTNAFFFSGTNDMYVTKLVTNPLDLSSGPHQVSYSLSMMAWGSDVDEFRIYYKEGADGEWIEIPEATQTAQVYGGASNQYLDFKHTIPAESSEVYIAFEGTSGFGHGICIDDIKIYEYHDQDLSVVDLLFESPVYGNKSHNVKALVQNKGENEIPAGMIVKFAENGVVFDSAVLQKPISNMGLDSLDTLNIQWFPNQYGPLELSAYPAADDNPDNDTVKRNIIVRQGGGLFADFSQTLPQTWDTITDENATYKWQHMDKTSFFTMDSGFAAIGVDVNGTIDTLITQPVRYDGEANLFGFQLKGLNNNDGYGSSTVQVIYSSDNLQTWNNIGDPIDMASGDSLRNVLLDLSSLDDTTIVYFGFAVTSTYEASGYKSWIGIDNVVGPVLTSVYNNDLKIVDIQIPSEFVNEGDAADVAVKVKNVGNQTQIDNQIALNYDGSVVDTLQIDTLIYNETQLLGFTIDATAAGRNAIYAQVVSDDNTSNNYLSKDFVTVSDGILVEGFESGVPPLHWYETQQNWHVYEDTLYEPYEGENMAAISDANGGFYNETLVTPPVQINSESELNFYAARQNANLGYASLDIVYSEDGTNWTTIENNVPLTDSMKLYTVDFTFIPDGDYHLGFRASGSGSNEQTPAILLDRIIGPENIPTYPVTFTLQNQNDEPVEEANIYIYNNDYQTDGDGEVEIQLPDGEYDYTISADSYETISDQITVNGEALTIDTALNLVEYQVRFKVYDGAQNPLEEVVIEVSDNSLSTNADGIATMLLPKGEYDFTASLEGYTDTTGTINVTEGQMITKNIRLLKTYLVSFHVTYRDGDLEEAEVDINDETLTTDENGETSIELPNGSYDYTVTKDEDFQEVSETLVVDSSAVSKEIYLSGVGIATNQNFNANIYPVPTKGIVNITLTGKATIQVYDATGSMISIKQINQTGTLNIENQPKGIYLIKALHENGDSETMKLLKH